MPCEICGRKIDIDDEWDYSDRMATRKIHLDCDRKILDKALKKLEKEVKKCTSNLQSKPFEILQENHWTVNKAYADGKVKFVCYKGQDTEGYLFVDEDGNEINPFTRYY